MATDRLIPIRQSTDRKGGSADPIESAQIFRMRVSAFSAWAVRIPVTTLFFHRVVIGGSSGASVYLKRLRQIIKVCSLNMASEVSNPLQEIRLLFTPSDPQKSSFTVQLEESPGKPVGAPASLTPFLDEDDYENLRWYLEEYMDLPDGGAVVRAQGVERQIEQWGRRLHEAVFGPPENATLLQRLLDAPEPRELTIATAESLLLRLPWELLRDDSGALAQRVAVRRQLEEPKTLVSREVQLPLRMLYIVSRPADTGFIDPRLTTRALVTALDPLGGNVRLDFCRPPTLGRMNEMLRAAQTAEDPYDIVHFDGHGNFLPEAQIGALCFERPEDGSDESTTDHVRADRLGDLLAQYKIPLVVLEACRSATMKAAVFRSVAPQLIRSGVGSVLSMGHAVHVEAARLLLDRFYRELASGSTIGHAVAQGRTALRGTPARWIEYGPGGRSISLEDWFLPHLYQRGLDEPLLPPKATEVEPVRQFDLFLSHNQNNKARVEALARELSDKHGLRVWFDRWEMLPGTIERQCEAGIQQSRFIVVAVSEASLEAKWVKWEIETAIRHGRRETHIIPVRLEPIEIQPELQDLLWIDLLDPAEDSVGLNRLASLIRSLDAADARQQRGFRPPPEHGQPGAFPRPPQYGFQGRARELYALERSFRRDRGIVLHAMGGMGKTTLASEAAQWWTRSGLFNYGACFVSFERTVMDAGRIVTVLGEYCEGPKFQQRPESEQRRRAIEFFRERAVLMVWDNYESVLPAFGKDEATARDTPYTDSVREGLAELFRDLTTGPGRGCVLVTCRPGEAGLPGARKFELQGLARADSLWLLHRILERDGASLEDPRLGRDRLEPLLRDLADHPLSLELIGPHLRTLTPEQIRADFGQLVASFRQESDQGRNTSLLASLEFSRRHLSEAARAALPWLALFSGGVFEDVFLDVSGLEPSAWDQTRAELIGIALLRIEDDVLISNRPFLRFHPTLSIASADATLAALPETRERVRKGYLGLMRALDDAFRGDQSRAAITILEREEMNWRMAVQWSLADGQHSVAAALGDTFSKFLKWSGRLSEDSVWVRMLHEAVAEAGFTEEASAYEREHAWTLFTQGDPQGAMDKLQSLVERLRRTVEFDPAPQLAAATLMQGRVSYSAGAAAHAVPILHEAVGLLEKLVIRKSMLPWEALLASPERTTARLELGNLSAAMGDLANALRGTGQSDKALEVAEKCVRIQQACGAMREVAADHARCAFILMGADRYDEADARYELALAASRRAGDKRLEGEILQHQGGLARRRNQSDRATLLYQQALQRFREADAKGSMMRTYNLLGVVEAQIGRFREARAWYEKSREIALQLKDQPGLAGAAQNIGIACQQEGEVARTQGDEESALRLFQQAHGFVEEGLQVWQGTENKPDEASSLSQLAKIQFLLGDVNSAERYAHAARKIRESLGLTKVSIDYDILSQIAVARGDSTAAAVWARKRDDFRAERKRRAGGGGISAQMMRALEALTLDCARAGFGGDSLDPGAEEALAKLNTFPAPLPEFSAALRRLAAGELPAIPDGLPAELHGLLEGITKAIRDQT